MPYIKTINRPSLDDHTRSPSNAGELNYVITRLCDDYITSKGKNYANLNEVMGVLSCAQAEFYRRIAAPYEDTKIKAVDGGEVYKNV